ncbi:MAG: hypothetical protein A3G93_00630 [Nitrospinae bacterium RIFCSPLOWO2_12_FULL_45_22]|nr:MAG: hypothetical protein A3G93_00630 [Nitrospinae bacterium RIFCSPLOWO2_12_FULL_45_22]
MSGKKMPCLLIPILGFVLLFPLFVSAGDKGDMVGRQDVTTNKSANDKATVKYEYQRLVKFYLYNDGHIDPDEQSVLKLLGEKWRISPKEVEAITREARKNIR